MRENTALCHLSPLKLCKNKGTIDCPEKMDIEQNKKKKEFSLKRKISIEIEKEEERWTNLIFMAVVRVPYQVN